MVLRVLEEFERLFNGQKYLHRRSTQNDWVARMFYEDLYALERSRIYNARVDEQHCVVNTSNIVTGQKSRRGDGLFGESLPGSTPQQQLGYNVAIGATANVQIGAEVKIVAKAMGKQIDRVIGDLHRQASFFKDANSSAITIGIAGVNHAARYTSYEGERAYVAEGREAPAREAANIVTRLRNEAAPAFDEFVILPFTASNEQPYPFTWNTRPQIEAQVNAALLRTLRHYENRF